MAAASPDAGIQRTFAEAERSGLKLAIRGRTLALLLIGVWFVATRSPAPQRALEFLALVAGFALVGWLHYKIIGSRFDRSWTKYVFITIDIAVLSALVATQPIYDSVDVPQSMIFRNAIFPYYFVALAVAAFSFSPGLVLWAGVAGVAGWLSAFAWAIRDMSQVLEWTDISANPGTDEFLSVFLHVDFVGTGSRLQESLAYFVVAVLIAIVMHRARRTVRRQLELDEERLAISELFGQYVPKAVAEALISDRGALAPVQREATILFADIAGFTSLTETAGAAKVVRVLNAFFHEVTRIVGTHGGVITQFQGDAVLATFNVPVEDPQHALRALQAALEIRSLVRDTSFDGTRIRTRIGVCTGPVIAGNVGGGGRRNYTVHGNTVNLAARLEALGKEHGCDLLVSDTTVTGVGEQLPGTRCERIGKVEVAGLSLPVIVYTVIDESK